MGLPRRLASLHRVAAVAHDGATPLQRAAAPHRSATTMTQSVCIGILLLGGAACGGAGAPTTWLRGTFVLPAPVPVIFRR